MQALEVREGPAFGRRGILRWYQIRKEDGTRVQQAYCGNLLSETRQEPRRWERHHVAPSLETNGPPRGPVTSLQEEPKVSPITSKCPQGQDGLDE